MFYPSRKKRGFLFNIRKLAFTSVTSRNDNYQNICLIYFFFQFLTHRVPVAGQPVYRPIYSDLKLVLVNENLQSTRFFQLVIKQ